MLPIIPLLRPPRVSICQHDFSEDHLVTLLCEIVDFEFKMFHQLHYFGFIYPFQEHLLSAE